MTDSSQVIADALQATNVQAYWAGTAFILGSAVLQPVFAALADPFGRRPMATVALAIFTIGTVVCAKSPTIATLLVGRTVQGIGGGGLLSLTYIVIGDILDKAEMAIGLGLITVAWILGTTCGPVMGGGFTQSSLGWRWIFWICLPIAGLSLGCILAGLKTSHERPPLVQGLKQTDWFGFLLSVGFLTSFLIAISWVSMTQIITVLAYVDVCSGRTHVFMAFMANFGAIACRCCGHRAVAAI